MGKATSLKMCNSIVNQYKQNISKSKIATFFKINRTTVHNVIVNYVKNGEEGLSPKYQNCGKQSPDNSNFVFRACCLLKRWHPTWGAERIVAEIRYKRPEIEIVSLRTVQRWLKKNRPKEPINNHPKTPCQWAKAPHEGWQIDAKEEMDLATKKMLLAKYN